VRLPKAPKTLAELEAQLLQSIDRLDRGEGIDGEQVFRRLLKWIKENNQSEVVREALRRMEKEENSYLNPPPLSSQQLKEIYGRSRKRAA